LYNEQKAQDGGDLLESRYGCLTPDTHRIGGWVGPIYVGCSVSNARGSVTLVFCCFDTDRHQNQKYWTTLCFSAQSPGRL